MARVQLSALVNDISGKVGGSVFQRTQGGLILRSNSGKIDSNSAQSNSRKVGMSSVQGSWQNLTNAQRLLWQTYAIYLNKKQKHNTSLIINGHQLFININSLRYDMSGQSALFVPYLLTTPVLAPLPLPITIVSVVFDIPALEVNISRATVPADEVVFLFMSRPLSASQVSPNTKMLLMKTPTPNNDQLDPTDYYISVYGRVPTVGEYVMTKIAIYQTAAENYSSFSVQRLIVT